MSDNTLELKFTGKATILIELDGYGPIELRIDSLDITKKVCSVILDEMKGELNVDSYDDDTEKVLRNLLNF
jgi:hypothetical protein